VWAPIELHGLSGSHPPERHAEDDDFVQAGNLYRLMEEAAKERLVENVTASLAQVSRKDIVERSIANFQRSDPDYADRIINALEQRLVQRYNSGL
jgi:catalase